MLVASSVAVAAGLLVVPDLWTGLLGVLPVALGVRALLTRGDDDNTPKLVTGMLGVAGMTIANGPTESVRSCWPTPGLRQLDQFQQVVAPGVLVAVGQQDRPVGLEREYCPRVVGDQHDRPGITGDRV